jgi:ABC-type phosphonate transport system ATPase subunit
MTRLRSQVGATSVPAGYKILLDVPSANPALGFDEIAQALAGFVQDSDPQFAVGIFGGWGSGKSTLMSSISRKLSPDRCVTVEFSAWRYEKEKHLIVPLLDTVRDALMAWANQHAAGRDAARRTASVIGKATRAIVAGLSLQVGVSDAMKVSFDANKAITEYRAGSESARVPQSFYHGSFAALRSAFDGFVGPATDRRIVVFVDDLDRCLPEGALEVLESMKLFFDLPGFVFVVGLDQTVVEHVIDMKYSTEATRRDANQDGAAQTETSQITGADYIKKIFQLPYTLTPIARAELSGLLSSIYQESELPDEQEREIENVVRPHLEHVTDAAAVNPREVKRYINAYTLTTRIRGGLSRDRLLALQTIAFRQDWRPARQALYLYRDVFIDALRRQIQQGQATALEDLDPDLLAVPESFLSYVAAPPGVALLEPGPIDEYLYAGEAARSTQGSFVLDAIRDAAAVRQPLRALRTSIEEREERAQEALKALSPLEGKLSSLFGRSLTAGLIREDLKRATETLQRLALPNGNRTAEGWAELGRDVDDRMGRVIRRLVDLYFAGDVGGAG